MSYSEEESPTARVSGKDKTAGARKTESGSTSAAEPLRQGMTRYVTRTVRRLRKPWEWKGVWPFGPPKTLLTNIHTPVHQQLTKQTKIVIGQKDFALRLYRRDEVSEVFYAHEWDAIKDSVDWIEQVDEEHGLVLRISMTTARMWGYRSKDGGFVVPLDRYAMHEQETTTHGV